MMCDVRSCESAAMKQARSVLRIVRAITNHNRVSVCESRCMRQLTGLKHRRREDHGRDVGSRSHFLETATILSHNNKITMKEAIECHHNRWIGALRSLVSDFILSITKFR